MQPQTNRSPLGRVSALAWSSRGSDTTSLRTHRREYGPKAG